MKGQTSKSKGYPLVTVITPTYNRADFLEETILSVLNQNYPNIEYIVLDGNSTDNTLEVVKKFKEKIIWDSHKNMGEQWAVNKGFSMSHGDIIGVVNSDDPLLPGAIKEMVKFLSGNPNIIAVYPDWIKIDKDGKEIERIINVNYSYEYMVRNHYCLPGQGTFFRRILIDKLKGHDLKLKYVADYDFWLRAGLIGQIARIPKFLATFRMHSDAATIKHRGYEMAIGHIKVINKVYSLPNLPLEVIKVKAQAYAKAAEAARICRGDKLSTKILISLISLYYSPKPYLKEFISFRIHKLAKLLN